MYCILNISNTYTRPHYEAIRVSSINMLTDQQKQLLVAVFESLDLALEYIEMSVI